MIHTCDILNTYGLGYLHGQGADASACAVDQQPVMGFKASHIKQALNRQHCRVGHTCGLMKVHFRRDVCQCSFGGANILRKPTKATLGQIPVDGVAWLKRLDRSTNRFHVTRYIDARNCDLWPKQTAEKSNIKGLASYKAPIPIVHRRRTDPDENLIFFRKRRLQVNKFQLIGGSIGRKGYCFHYQSTLAPSFPASVWWKL